MSCKTVNCIYMLECRTCKSQYIGETVQDLKDRIGQHRRCTKDSGDSGNFRIRQHFACSDGYCSYFNVYILQKLQGNGRISEFRSAVNKKAAIDKTITAIRKEHEDKWVRSLHTQFPYGLNDRIDSLKNKWMFNCEFAKFWSPKNCDRKRSWKRGSVDQAVQDNENIVHSLISFLKLDYHSSIISKLKRLLFPLKKSLLRDIQKSYLKEVFTNVELKNEVLYKQSHFVISDLLMYKIQPFNSSKVAINIQSNCRKRRLNFKLLFVNKALDMINLPLIFRNKELKSFVNFCNIPEPSVQYQYRSGIGSKLFNYNQTSNNFNSLDDIECVCRDPYFQNFINDDCDHVACGNFSIFKSSKLRNLVEKGPKYREPANLDFDLAKDSILKYLDQFVKSWADSEQYDVQCFIGWKNKFINLLEETVSNLRNRYISSKKYRSVFKDPTVVEDLNYFQKHFVICPVDKASKNIAIICKKFYCETILNECLCNEKSYCQVTDRNTSDICSDIRKFVKDKFTLDISSGAEKLSHIVLFPKFHKPKFSQRFVVSYADCFIKPLSSRLMLGLKAVYKKICSYSDMIFKVTGIRRNWIIENNVSILDSLDKIEFGRNIQTYDFTTLYTNLEHSDISTALSNVIKLAFKHAKRNFISIYDKSFAWVNKAKDTTFTFDEESLIEAVNFLLDNCYFTFGNRIFRQIIGVPIGVDPGPYIANLTLWFYENRYLEKTYKKDYHSAMLMNKTFRLIDDITVINSNGVFASHIKDIYPESLNLNKENSDDSRANVLDLNIVIHEGKFKVNLYDKRDDFPFKIVQFSDSSSNISRNTILGVFKSQVLRYARICSEFQDFLERLDIIVKKFMGLGFGKKLLKSHFVWRGNIIFLESLEG